ncbi:MAG: Ktr system potassium uptake protein B [Candidatus Dichloromethanomonas elyunquensis]|nr:MAG: Ktr system potassium uptake protein B [Candidatus Dichloromethanomonas elyunquensis]
MSEIKILLNSQKANSRSLLMTSSMSPARILAIGFALLILLGGALLSLPIATENYSGTPYLDAVFTATSALCVTGLVVVDTADHYSFFGEIVILCLIQIGGLGFMSFATLFAILLGRKINLRQRIILQESFNQLSLEGIVRLVKSVLIFSFAIEGMGALLLFLRWYHKMGISKGAYYAIFHSISAFNNAGFDLYGGFRSLTAQTNDLIVNLTIMSLIIAGGLGFTVLVDIYQKRGGKLNLHSRLVLQTTFLLIVISFIFILFNEMNNQKTIGDLDWYTKILASLFQSVAPRTAGFSTLQIADFNPSTLFFMIILMFIGASPGSTGGGIKTTTFLSVILCIVSVLKGNENVVTKERTLPHNTIRKSFAITILALIWVVTVIIVLLRTETTGLLSILFEIVSAFGTVGLTMGLTPSLSVIGKIFIILTMYFGRVGLVTVALAISLKNKKHTPMSHIKYPEDKIIIG